MAKKLLIAAAIVYFVAVAAVVLVIAEVRGRGDVGPRQPIDFSHEIHIKQVALDCTHCHQYADQARQPGIPALEVCMECHQNVATDRPEVQKLTQYWESGEPVEWVRVYDVPWHVHFTHKRHVKAGVACETCHGEVSVQSRVRQVTSLKMGWCVSCHRANGADTDCLVCHR